MNLLTAIRERNISVYRVMKLLNIPQSGYSRLALKIKGFANIKPIELERICEAISAESGKELRPEDVDFEPVWIRLIPEHQDSGEDVLINQAADLNEQLKQEQLDAV